MTFKAPAAVSSGKPHTLESTGNEMVKVISQYRALGEGLRVISRFAFHDLRMKDV